VPLPCSSFCARAGGAQPRFAPSAADVEAIVEICRRLDANPLAIELAAARVPTLSPAQIADRLILLRAFSKPGVGNRRERGRAGPGA
jgi:predicted ATPase